VFQHECCRSENIPEGFEVMVDYQSPIIHGPKIGFVSTALTGNAVQNSSPFEVVTNE
jgi:hypothetical protein